MKILYTANELHDDQLESVTSAARENSMRQPDGVTRERLEEQGLDALRPANEHLREIDTRVPATVANERPSEEVLTQTLAGCLTQVVRSRDTFVAQLNEAVAAATTAAQHLAQREAELAAAKAEAATLRESLERQLAHAQDRTADAEAAAGRLTRRESELVETVAAHQNLQRRFSAALTLLQEQDADLEATTKRLTGREAELAEATETRLSLETKLAEAESALGEGVRRSAADRSTAIQQAAQRQSEFDAVLKEKVAKYDTLAQDLSATRQELAHANTTLQEAEARHASAVTTAAAQRNEWEAQHKARMAEATAARDAVSRQLLEATAALDSARQDHLIDARASAERLAQQEAKLREGTAARQTLEGQLADAHATRERLEQAVTVASNKIAETETAIRDAEQRHASHIATVTARFDDQQVQHETDLAEAAIARELVDQRLREVEASFERSRQEAAADAAAAAERLARLETQQVEALANLQRLEGQLADANAARHVAEQRVATERLIAERQAGQRQAAFEAEIARETAGRHAVEQDLAASQQKLAESESALRNAEQRHASEVKTATSQFAERQREFEATLERIHNERAAKAIAVAEQLTQLESELAKATANGETLERRLTEVTNALHTAEELAVSERAASAERATERQTEFDARLSLELGTRNTIEQALATTRQNLLQTETALRDALAQHTTEKTKASNELSEQRSQYTTQLAQASAAHAALEQKLADLDRRHASALKAAATQLSEQQRTYETRVTEVTRTLETVSKQLHDTETTLLRTQQESDANAIAFAERLSQRDSEIAAVSAARQLLEGRLADTETALKHSEAQALAERTATIEQSAQGRAEFDAQLAREVEARNIVERDLAETRVTAEQNRQTLLGQSAALTKEMRELELRLLQQLAQERADYDGKLAGANEHFERMRQAKEVELQRLGADHAASQEAARQALAKLETELRSAVTAHRQQVDQLHSGLKAVRQNFEASRAASQRQFDESPMGILRCSDAGVLKEANRALITALGYRIVDQLRALDSATSVFESPDDFRWLIERCERTTDSVDCILKKKDGSRLTMRLRAIRLAADVVDIVAEDVTTLRAVEERLRQAQRIEAVGRLASEVADTCDILLRNVSQDGQQWLASVGSNTAQRHQGELILGDVTRAATFLRQLSVYGEKQTSARGWVDVNTVLRDLAPVLKRVAGDDIELVLPKKVSALNVDVDAERVERVLVNIAAYGRARMPSGGRLNIELARAVADLDFVTKYPNVRQGEHALISVTEVRTAAPAESPTGTRETVETTAIGATSARPGVDLGTLQRLIGDCGGHLWMKAEPGGNMEVKIHLPLRSADTSKSAGILSSARGRLASTWFQS